MRFFTVTLNPAFDRLVSSSSSLPVRSDDTIRTDTVTLKAGGKGINSARELTYLGEDCTAIALCGSKNSDAFRDMLKNDKIKNRLVLFDGSIRTNTTVNMSCGQFEINESGDLVEAADHVIENIISLIDAERGDCVIIGGSLPNGDFENAYSDIILYARSRGAFVCLDTSGDALKNVLLKDALPDLIKPNREELESVLGRTGSIEENIELVKRFSTESCLMILETLGADGAVFAYGGKAIYKSANRIKESKISDMKGAGDSYLAAFLHGYLNIYKGDAEASMRLAADEAEKHLIGKRDLKCGVSGN